MLEFRGEGTYVCAVCHEWISSRFGTRWGKKPTELSEAQKMISHTVQREDGIWMTEFRQAGDAVPENTSLPRSLLGGERVLHRFLLPG